MVYTGTIIEESLENKGFLKRLNTINTRVEKVTQKHMTPWLGKWTLHKVQISDEEAEKAAKALSEALDSEHAWYADFKNDKNHYIIFRNKVFFVDRQSKEQYDEAKEYGISLGIPAYQVDFHPEIIEWKR